MSPFNEENYSLIFYSYSNNHGLTTIKAKQKAYNWEVKVKTQSGLRVTREYVSLDHLFTDPYTVIVYKDSDGTEKRCLPSVFPYRL